MLKEIKFETKITFSDIPRQWISKFELYYPDLPGFPIIYVHFIKDGVRVYGYPASLNVTSMNGQTCDVEFLFQSNENLDNNQQLKDKVTSELKERIGLSQKISIADIISSCKGNQEYEKFFKELWKYVKILTGEYIPFGRFFEETYSIVRFVSAWNPKTGRQSEMRMLYNFLSQFGEKIPITNDWSFQEFYLLPTYEELKNETLDDFAEFKKLFLIMKIVWNEYFTKSNTLKGTTIMSMEKAWPMNKDVFIKKVSQKMFDDGKISKDEQNMLEKLVDMFNRHPRRTTFFIWSIMTIKSHDYTLWDKDYFTKFYTKVAKGTGISPKVTACFLQQGFGKDEFIPVDTWVKSFQNEALGIKRIDEFFKNFDKMGKLERIIWIASQANKTNMRHLFDTLWCIRYGNKGNKDVRGPNPIGCYECKLIDACPSYKAIKDLSVLVKKEKDAKLVEGATKSAGTTVTASSVISEAAQGNCHFICLTQDGVPKKICVKKGRGGREKWKVIDEFSGYRLSDEKTNQAGVSTVSKIINSLPTVRKCYLEN